MKLVTRVFSCCLFVLALAASVASAKPVAQVEPLPTGTQLGKHLMGPLHANAACEVGVTGPAAWLINYILPPNDAYYTLLDPATCAACPTGSLIATSAHVALSFGYICTQPITVAVYGAIGAPGCYQPDLSTVYAAPTTYNVTPAAIGVYDFVLPLPPGACFSGPAFLMVEFPVGGTACNTSTKRPRLVTTDGCVPCTSWNIYPGGGPDDLCDPLIGFPGNPMMWVDADCCAVVPTTPGTWGKLKVLYR